MRKTPSYLKGLAETRARVSAEVQRYQLLHDEIGQALERAKAELVACDTLIRKYDERLNPELIEPIKAWKGRYGKRGELKETILETLKARAPDFVTTTELVWELQVRFRLDFISWRDKVHWARNIVGKQLRRLADQGVIERLHDPMANTGEVGSWRWKGEGCESLGDLVELAKSAGVATSVEVAPYEAYKELPPDDLPV